MDEFRLALLATRILAVVLLTVAGSWLFAWALTAANDWVFTGALARSSFRQTWATYAMINAVAGIFLGRFAHPIARLVTRP
jgi:hypothetical protein